MVTLTLIQGVVNTFVVFLSRVVGYVVDKAVFTTERGVGMGYYITVIVCQIVFGILASIIVAWFSRQREFRADAASAGLLGSPRADDRGPAPPGRPRAGALLRRRLQAFGIAEGNGSSGACSRAIRPSRRASRPWRVAVPESPRRMVLASCPGRPHLPGVEASMAHRKDAPSPCVIM